MKKIPLALLVAFGLSIFTTGVLPWTSRQAGASFNANRIMDDSVFSNVNTLTASQINGWLNSNFPQSCISTNNGFKGRDPTGYSPSKGFTYGSFVSAGKVIYDAAQAYGLNPQVILATLQKESSVVSGTASYGCHYLNTAMGYGCPDGGSCPQDPATESGFSKQVIHATWLFRFGQQRSLGNVNWAVIKGNWDNSDDPYTYYGGPMTQGYRARVKGGTLHYYDGYTTIDNKSVHMDTGATAALYWYTPHFSGNKNFYNIFTGWFGPTTGPFYSLSSEILPPTKIEYGHTANVEFKLKNNSSQTWYSDGNTPAGVHPFRLMTWKYTNTPFANTSDSAWLGTRNQIKMKTASVAPGGTATFDFTLRAPQYSMSTNLIFVLVQDGVQVHSDVLLKAPTSSVPDYAYRVVSATYPPGLLPGDAYKVVVKLKNTGMETWYSDSAYTNPANTSGRPIRLATSGYRNSPYAHPNVSGTGWLTQNQIRMVGTTVAPGSTGTFQGIIYAPYKQISFSHYFKLVLDGVKFVSGPSIKATVSTPSPVATYTIVSRSSPSNMTSGQTAVVKVVLHNTGNIIWRNIHRKVAGTSTIYPLRDVRLITWNPAYHTSAFWAGTPEWIGTKDQITSASPIVGPGSNATYNITFKAPPVAKRTFYNEQFNLVLDGQIVMPFEGLHFPITVTP